MSTISHENWLKLDKLIELDEGFRQFPYRDTKDKLTIGFGFNLESEGIPKQIATIWLDWKLSQIQSELVNSLPVYNTLDDVRKIVLVNIAFNCGVAGLMGFRRMIAALNNDNFLEAGKEIRDSELAANRKERLAYLMETGELNL